MKNTLHQALEKYIRSYYRNEWIKGIFVFVFLSSVLWIFLIFLEWFLWLSPSYKTGLYFFGWTVTLFFAIKFVFYPLLQYFGFFRKLDEYQVARQIGEKIPEISDGLLNYLELEKLSVSSSALLQTELQRREKLFSRYDFNLLLSFNKYFVYIYLLFLPLFVLVLLKITGKAPDFTSSYQRLQAYHVTFQKPAPYHIQVLSPLEIPDDTVYTLRIQVSGEELPEKLWVQTENDKRPFIRENDSVFIFKMNRLSQNQSFIITDDLFRFGPYDLKIFHKPVLKDYSIEVKVPAYVRRHYHDTIVKESFLTVPQGSVLIIQLQSKYTDSLSASKSGLIPEDQSVFKIQVFENQGFDINLHNLKYNQIRTYHFQVNVIPDRAPEILVKTVKDTTSLIRKHIHLVQLKDDYKLTSLELHYKQPDSAHYKVLKITGLHQPFYTASYIFPQDFKLPDTLVYHYFFRVYDNRSFHGHQFTDSEHFVYRPGIKSRHDLDNQAHQIFNSWQHQQKQSDETFRQLHQSLENYRKQKSSQWERQKEVSEVLQETRKLNEDQKELLKKLKQLLNLYEQDATKKDELKQIKKRIKEIEKLIEKNKKEKELEELLKTMQEQNMLSKLQELKDENQLKKQSLDRVLELTKRFFIHEQLNKMSNQLKDLAKKQQALAQKKVQNEFNQQKNLLQKTDSLSKQFDSLSQMNKQLKSPVKIPPLKTGFKAAKMFQKQSLEELKQNKSGNAPQKKSAQELNQMSSMLMQMMMQGNKDQQKEDIEQIKKLIQTLLLTSFEQENLYQQDYRNIHLYTENLLKQNKIDAVLRAVFDSLEAIARRQPAISNKIFEHLFEALNQSGESIAALQDKHFHIAQIKQHATYKEINELIYLLNLFLESKKGMGMGMSSGKNQDEQQLPSLIKKRSEKLSQQMQQMLKQGKNKSSRTGQGEKMSKQAYQLYKEHQQLKDLLNRFNNQNPNKKIQALNDKIEALSKKLLKEGIKPELLNQLLQLQYELLKILRSVHQQHEDNKRISKQPVKQFGVPDSLKLKLIEQYFPQYEQLYYQSLQMQKIYMEKYKQYKTKVK